MYEKDRIIVERYQRVYNDDFKPHEFPEIAKKEMEIVKPEFIDSVRFKVDKHQELYSDTEYAVLFMVYSDYENEQEYNERIQLEEMRKKYQEERDRAEFDRLSKKFKS